MLINVLALILGIVFAGLGGEAFLRGMLGIAQWRRIAPGIVGATLAAFATSSPELTVSITASSMGSPEIALGDALGANVVNFALILGLVVMIGSIHSTRAGLRRDFSVAVIAPVITAILAADGLLSRLDGLILLSLFVAWISVVAIKVRREPDEAGEVLSEHHPAVAGVLSIVGLALLIVAGRAIVFGAQGLVQSLGIDSFIIGALIVAVGTTIPELATAVISRIRGHDEVGLGTILGSNIFNGLLIVAVACIITPITFVTSEVMITLGVGLLAVLVAFPNHAGTIARARGFALLGLYVAYVAFIVT